MNNDYLNIIQLICGIGAALFIFLGLFTSFRKLNKEDSTQKVPKKTMIRSMIFIGIGLILYAAVKTCTGISKDNGDNDLFTIYSAYLIEVIKYFGFLILIPLLINYLKKKPYNKPVEDDYEEAEEDEDGGISSEDQG